MNILKQQEIEKIIRNEINNYFESIKEKFYNELMEQIKTKIFLSQLPEVSDEEQKEINKLHGKPNKKRKIGSVDYVELGNVENNL